MSEQIERTNGIDLEGYPTLLVRLAKHQRDEPYAVQQGSWSLAIATTSRSAVRRVVVFSPESLQLAASSCELAGKGPRSQDSQKFWPEYRQSA